MKQINLTTGKWKMKRTTKIILLLLLLLITIGYCRYHFTDKRPQRSCPVESLILDEELLPPGHYADTLNSPALGESDESASRSFSYKSDAIYNEVFRRPSEKLAKKKFEKWIEVAFNVNEYEGPWERPEEIDYVSPIADNYEFACGKSNVDYTCKLVATYDEYFVLFLVDVSKGGITLEMVEEMLIAMDQRMAECLQE